MRGEPRESWYAQVVDQLRGYLFDNLRLKALAALIVAALWLTVAGQTRSPGAVVVNNLTVSLVNAPPNLTITSTDPAAVSVQLRGPEEVIRELKLSVAMQSNEIVPTVDLSETEEGIYRKPVFIEGLPDGVVVQRVVPSWVRVSLEPLVTRQTPVEHRLIGQLPPGYKLVDARLSSATVDVRGPESRVNEIVRLRTTTVNLNGHTDSFSEEVEADITDPEVVPVGPSRLVLEVTIEPEVGERTIENVPVRAPAGEANPATVSVTVRGPLPVIEPLTAESVTVTVDDGGAPGNRVVAPRASVNVAAADRVEVVRVAPSTVRWR